MKKFLCVFLSAILIAGTVTLIPASAAKKPAASLKSKSVTLKITKKKGKTVYESVKIKINKIKGVKIKKTTFKSSDKKIAKVSKSGKVTAVKKGKAAIKVSVKYTLKKRTYTKKLSFKVTVKDERKKTSPTVPATDAVTETETITEPSTDAITETETATETATESESASESQTETFTEPAPTETEPPTEPPTETYGGDAVSKRLNNVPEAANTYTSMDKDFLDKLSRFSNKLYTLSAKDETGNYAMSPASVYMAMAMLYYVGDDGVKTDVKTLVGMSDEQIKKTGELFNKLTKKFEEYSFEDNKRISVGKLALTNSIWLNEGENADAATLKTLAEELYCHAYEAPFKSSNQAANKAVREFIKEQTNGLIDKDFGLDEKTVFALINTLYFKDVWSMETQKLRSEKGDFSTSDGTIKTDFLYGSYLDGQAQETDKCTYFYTKTAHGYKIKFILPKDGFTLKEAMTEENLNTVNSDDDFDYVDKNRNVHLTRCIFPSFKVNSDTKLKDIFKANGLLQNSFSYFTSPLIKDKAFEVSDIKHTTVINVSDEGVEGAAVTIVIAKEATAIDPSNYVYHDFVLDKNFGFIITDYDNVVLFEGQVTKPEK